MIPAKLDLIADRAVMAGDPYTVTVAVGGEYFAGVDFAGWTFEAEIRPRTGILDDLGQPLDPVATFDVDVIDDTEGAATITLTLDRATTAALAQRPLRWDLQAVDDDGDPHTLLRGRVTVLGEVTATSEDT